LNINTRRPPTQRSAWPRPSISSSGSFSRILRPTNRHSPTIRVKYPIAPDRSQLPLWDKQVKYTADGKIHERYTCNRKLTIAAISVRCTYFPVDYQGNPLTSIELSLPMAVFGNNYCMIDDLEAAIAQANALLALDSRLPQVDLGEGTLIRLDPCYNHQVGPLLVPDYINAIGQLEYPHRRTKLHRNEGAEFRAKHVTTKFYDKERETRNKQAAGILRQETSLLEPKTIANLLGLKNPTLRDVTPERIAMILNLDLAYLKMFGRPIADRDTALAALTEKHGPLAGLYYFGFLEAKLIKSKRQLATQAKLHPRTLDRRIKAIVDAGIAPTLTETTEPLPPLEIRLSRSLQGSLLSQSPH